MPISSKQSKPTTRPPTRLCRVTYGWSRLSACTESFLHRSTAEKSSRLARAGSSFELPASSFQKIPRIPLTARSWQLAAVFVRYTSWVEKESAEKSVSFCVMNRQAGFSAIFATAGVSLVVLLVVAVWQIGSALRERGDATSYVATSAGTETSTTTGNADVTLSEDGTTPLGAAVLDGVVEEYLSLQEQGIYTEDAGAKSAEKMAQDLIAPLSYRTYTAADISTASDTSYGRMLAYRTDLQVSLAPLLKNTQAEFEIFASYVDTKDTAYLEKLRAAAQNYRAAANATARVVPPKDALAHHLAVLNALEKFAVALDTLAANADDPFASVVVLRSYNQAETNVLTSFASLAKYYREKRS